MNPVEATLFLLEELKRQRREGRKEVFVNEESMRALESSLSSFQTPNPSNKTSGEQNNSGFPIQVTSKENSSILNESAISSFTEQNNTTNFPDPPAFKLPAADKKDQWNWLKKKVLGCEICNRELNPKGKVVFGVGNLDSDIFFCGEAPGAEEELAGIPFIGPAGELLDRIIQAMGISRDLVYIGNTMNWRPRHNQSFGNRPPTQEEMAFCMPYLLAQIDIVLPKVIVALGKTATDALLGHDPKRRLADCRGEWSNLNGIPLMVTYHPSYLLHNPSKKSKRKVWEDMLLVMEKLQMPVSEKQRGFFLQD